MCIFTSPLFAQSCLKKELGICGKMMSVVFKTSPAADPEFVVVFKLDEDFCDYGRYEENANYILYLYDAKDKLIYDKHVYLNPVNIQESTDPKKPGKLTLQKIEKVPMSRIVKFPMAPQMGEIKKYRIESLIDKKSTSLKTLNWQPSI